MKKNLVIFLLMLFFVSNVFVPSFLSIKPAVGSQNDWEHVYTFGDEYQFSSFYSLYSNPLNSSMLYAAHFDGFYYSDNNGKTWEKKTNYKIFPFVKPYQSKVYAGIVGVQYKAEIGLYESTDNGDSFKQISSEINRQLNKPGICPEDFESNPQNNNILYFAHCFGLSYSFDYGRSWKTYNDREKNYSIPFYSIATSENKPNIVICSGVNKWDQYSLYVVKSEDSGYTWKKIYGESIGGDVQERDVRSKVVVDKKDPNNIYCFVDKNNRVAADDEFVYSLDGGSRWNKTIHPIKNAYINDICFSEKMNCLLASTTKGLYKFDRNKLRWEPFYLPNSKENRFRDKSVDLITEIKTRDAYVIYAMFEASLHRLTLRPTYPVLEVYSPEEDHIETEEDEILIQGRAYDEETNIKSITINNEELIFIEPDGSFEYYYPLKMGENLITITALNDFDLATSKEIVVHRFEEDQDNTPPTIEIISPLNDEVVYSDNVMVTGIVFDHESGVRTFTINNQEVQINDEGEFSANVQLRVGINIIQLLAYDYADNHTEESIAVIREEKEEEVEDEELIIIELWIGERTALVNKEPLRLDTPPIIYNGRTVVPARFIAEAFGADVFYDAKEQEINIALGKLYISVWVNKTRAKIEITEENGKRENHYVNLDVPPIIRNGRTLLPLRFVADVFGASIEWDGKEEKITIHYVKGSVGSIPEDYAPIEDKNIGNSAGNINNRGIATLKDGWIYYRNDNDGFKIYKIRPDGTGRQKVNNDNSGCISIVDDWIYYYKLDDGNSIYKIRTNGTGRQKINNDESSNINVVGGWIYYCNHGDLSKIYKIRINGLQREKINNEHSQYINVVGDWIYYVNEDDRGNIYKIRINGTDRQKVNEDISQCINVAEDWIFYTNRDARNNNLYKIGINGLNRERINNDRTTDINVVGSWIYYINDSDDCKIYKIRSDGTGRQKVNNDSSIYINVVGNWIYYCNENDHRKIYRIDTDGNYRQRIQ